jgi:hypothetical protein
VIERRDALTLLAAARWSGWPPRTLGGRPVRGEAQWRLIAARMTPPERAAVLSALGRRDMLVATPGGRYRLRQWLNRCWAGAWESPRPLRFDEGLLPAVEHALIRLPGPVRDHVVDACYVLAVGAHLAGWTSPPLATAGLCPIVVSGSEFEPAVRITLHEAAHSWHSPSLAAEVTMPTHVERAALLAYARDHGWPLATAAASAADDEALAHACTWAWLAAADAR